MVPFDGPGAQHQAAAAAQQPLPRPPMPPPGTGMPQQQQQRRGPPYPPVPPPHHLHHRNSSGGNGGPMQPPPFPGMPPPPQQSPQQGGVRRGSFGSLPGQQQQQQGGPPPPPYHHPHMQSPTGGPPPHAMHMQQQQRQPPQHMSRASSSSSSQALHRPPPPQQQFMNWQSDKDMPHRREMIQHIVKMLKKDKNNNPDWQTKLPQMAKQLEVSLYRNARSFDAYMDKETLKTRLQSIAVEVSRKARADGAMNINQSPSQEQQQMQNGMRGGSISSPYSQQQQDRRGSAQASSRHMVNMDEINPMAGATPSSTGGQSASSNGAAPYPSTSGRSRSSMEASRGGSISSSNPMNQGRDDPDWKARIKHKQQRLLLLHHAAKCPHNDGKCPTTHYCTDMKRLWKHMEGCKDNNCRVPHCFSSRAILSHYRKCKDPQCPACGPVRETVRKTNSQMPGSGSSVQTVRTRNGEQSSTMSYSSSSQQPRGMMATSPVPPAGSFASASSRDSGSMSGRQPSSGGAMPPPPNAPPANGMAYPSSSGGGGQYRSSSTSSSRVVTASTSGNSAAVIPSDPNGGVGDVSSSGRRGSASSSGAAAANARNDSEWQKVRHKQQRLLLLRHASKCKFEPGQCPVTPHCASMKKLWEHIAHCKDHQCTVQHCMSSRYVLSHYRRCKDPRCLSCGPVRDTIRKASDREKARLQSGAPMPSNGMQLDPEQQMLVSITSEMSAAEQQSLAFQPQPKRSKTEYRPSTSHPAKSRSPPPSSAAFASAATAAVAPPPPEAASRESSKSDVNAKPDDHSLINSFTVNQIRTHIKSLNRAAVLNPQKLKSKCNEILRSLQNHQHGWVFNNPVDPVELGLPDYFDIIKKPMDLGTINRKLESGTYHTIAHFMNDVNLTFDNAMLYNEEGSVVHDMAKELKERAATDHQKVLAQLEQEDRARRMNERACTLCGCEKLLFEPPVFFCNGMNCQSQRIRRNSHFYVGGNNQYYWCNQCYNELDDSIPIELMDMSIMKHDLKKRKNDEVHEESWVECDGCKSWVHQICGLFNSRQNKEHHTKYYCPICLLKIRERGRPPAPRPLSAVELPRTKLSEALEEHVREKVEERKLQLIREKAAADSTTLEQAREALGLGGPIIIRQVTATERKLEVRERMKKRYEHKGYPDEFPFRCKCIVVFQNIDGVDVILFALYVYEHGEDNPPPNQRTVYISYLDSVHFMRPRKLRTFVYHEILIKYLDYVRNKGFATAHIWACPPLKGDDYIFYAKPEDQKTPRDARLRQWYIDMLVECQRRSIVGKLTNMYDLYFADESLDATAVPYLEGDYFPGEAENVIKEVEEGKGKKSSSSGKKNKPKKSKANKNRKGTRATGIDEEALLASGILDEKKLFEESTRDQVMVKLGETIFPMKESFLVAFLNWSGARPEDLVVPDEIAKYRQENPDALAPLLPPEDKKPEDSTEEAEKKQDAESKPAAEERSEEPTLESEEKLEQPKPAAEEKQSDESKPEAEEKKPDESKPEAEEKKSDESTPEDSKAGTDVHMSDANETKPDEKTSNESKLDSDEKMPDADKPVADATMSDAAESRPEAEEKADDSKPDEKMSDASEVKPDVKMSDAGEVKVDEKMPDAGENKPDEKTSDMEKPASEAEAKKADKSKGEASKLEEPMPESKDDKAESSNKKRDAEGNVRDAEQSEETKSEEGDSKVKVIDDDAEDMDCEFFNNRQAFLNLCRGNHYQFDEIRRAKHTSMMVLWHLHNRDAPKFVQQCASCLKEILSGVRFHCDICPEYDICQNCYRSSQCNRGACAHRLRPVAVDNAQDTKGEGRLTEAQRRERQRNLELHIQLIEHAARCNSSSCTSSNCAKMKSYLQHGQVCKVRASGGCKICKRIWTLLRIHAQKCKDRYCPVPQCIAIRDRLRQMAKQQQAMDDRRRQEMNRHYRMNMMGHNRP